MQAKFVLSPQQTAVAVQYTNGAMIADGVCPRVPASGPLFFYNEFDKGTMFTVPETETGRTSPPPKVDFKSDRKEASTVDHALDIPVPYSDVSAWEAQRASGDKTTPDPMLKATEVGSNLLLLRREVRVATMYSNASNFGYSTVLGTGDQWDDLDSDPQEVIDSYMEQMVMKANVGWCNLKVANRLRRNNRLVKYYFGAGGQSGRLSVDQLAEVLGLKKLFVGESRINTASKGETPNLQNCWGNDFGMAYIDLQADTNFGITFGFTGQYGTRKSGQVPDPDMGAEGGAKARTFEKVRELIIAKDLGVLIKDAVSA